MASLNTISLSYKGKDYPVVIIPGFFTSVNQRLLVGSHSLEVGLYDDDNGYVDEEAKEIDEQIYVFVDDNLFVLSSDKFIDIVKALLD